MLLKNLILRRYDENFIVSLDENYTSCYLNYMSQTKVDGRGIREKKFDDGRREIIYPNGNVKKISADGRIMKMIYYNGDMKETDVAEGSEKYYYAQTKTWHTNYKDGLEVLEFPKYVLNIIYKNVYVTEL